MTSLPTSLLTSERVLLDVRAADEAAAIRAVTAVFNGSPDEVIAREKLSSTALCCGVAFPHARTELVQEIVVAAGRSVAGVPFTGGKELVHFVFVIGTPPNRAAQYLAFVGTLARALRGESVRQQLLTAATADDFVAVLRASV